METNNGWVKLASNLDIGDDSTSITCDCRDFHLCIHNGAIELIDGDDPYYKEFNETFRKILDKEPFDTKYVIEYDEIVPFLVKLRTLYQSDVKGIIFCFNVEGCEWWLKYVRIYQIEKGKYVVCNRNGKPIEWRLLDETTLQKIKYTY